ncbi:MAG TPA: hypothetical protein PLP33_24845 [Leptospiraceae bacterium]|nr:hypothetical protein [Leptospiraceae bacterium]
MFSLDKIKLFSLTEALFARKCYRFIPVLATIVLIYITNKVIVYFFTVHSNQKFLMSVTLTNFITAMGCVVGSYILISSAMRRESQRHFFNAASIYFGTLIALLGTSLLTMNYIIIQPTSKSVILAINIVTATITLLIATTLWNQRKQLIKLPDLIELIEIKNHLEHEVKVLKSTHPHLNSEDEASTSEIILTLSKTSAFLEKLSNK